MARIVKEHDERQSELLDAAQHLFFEKSYEKTSVNDIIDKVGVAKGTFYHYFKSKEDLLDKLVERFNAKTTEETSELVARQDLPALDKLSRFFFTIRSIKMENRELMVTLMKFMYAEDNLRFKHKTYKLFMANFVPELAAIIRQGQEEGTFSPLEAETTAELMMGMALQFGEIIVDLFLKAAQHPENLDIVEKKMRIYINTLERILGIEENTINIVDRKLLDNFKT